MLLLLRCGWCGAFCDNTGRIFKPTRPLILICDRLDKGTCVGCSPSLKPDDEAVLNKNLGKIRSKVNEYTSTGKTSTKPPERTEKLK